jgi:antitoxin (DNA-binding transcriptional repressor) of toxin-antitoxin stability system
MSCHLILALLIRTCMPSGSIQVVYCRAASDPRSLRSLRFGSACHRTRQAEQFEHRPPALTRMLTTTLDTRGRPWTRLTPTPRPSWSACETWTPVDGPRVTRNASFCEAVGRTSRLALRRAYAAWRIVGGVSEIPLDEAPRTVTDAAHDAARGQVVYLTEHGERLAAIVPAELAAELENLSPEAFRELLEDFADTQAARESLAEIAAGGKPVAAAEVWAELGVEAEPGIGEPEA